MAQQDDGTLAVRKLLSENPGCYEDAAVYGIRKILEEHGLSRFDEKSGLPRELIRVVKMGTTVATNALLERSGEPVVLVTTKGFRDALRIGYQNRPHLFSQEIILPEPLYQEVIEINQRHSAQGEEILPVDTQQAREKLQASYDLGIRSCAIVFLHGYRFYEHEMRVAEMAREIGYQQVSTSYEISQLMKFVSRGDTTVVDAYLSPVLRRYVEGVSHQLRGVPLMFMQSNGGLTEAQNFRGKDSILSGPAGGVVGAVETGRVAGFDKIISFDMGGHQQMFLIMQASMSVFMILL